MALGNWGWAASAAARYHRPTQRRAAATTPPIHWRGWVQADVAGNPLYPREVMKWSSDAFYAPIFNGLRTAEAVAARPFLLNEHDYCFGDQKFAGNAQSISRARWVHHTSFLWDYHRDNMSLLLLPEKRPDYRADRPHTAFLTRLKEHVAGPTVTDPDGVFDAVAAHLGRLFDVVPVSLEEALEVGKRPQERRTNTWVDISPPGAMARCGSC